MLKRAQALFLRRLGAVLASAAAGVSAHAESAATTAQYASRSHRSQSGSLRYSHGYDVDMHRDWRSSFWFHVLRYVRPPQISRRGSGELP